MIRLKKRDIKKALKSGAKASGITVSEMYEIMQANIDEAINNSDPEVQETFKKYFENKRPTPEEYIYTLTKKVNG